MIVLTQENLVDAGCFNVSEAIKVTEDALMDFAKGDIIFPDKVSQIFDEKTQDRINCMPATILSKKVCGMKWVAVFPPNPTLYQLPNLNATILLSEIRTGYPLAIMDGTLCSDLRTAAISGIAAKYLAIKNATTIGYIGSGEQAKMNFLAMMSVMPSIKTCKVASRRKESEIRFINQLKKLYPNIEYISCDSDYSVAAKDSDIIVTAVSCQRPLLQAEWLKEGALYCHVGGWEDAYEVPLSVDKIVCDDWNSVKHRTQTISRLYKMGKLHDDDIYGDLYEIVSGKKTGRKNDKEIIYFNTVGLSYVDVALGYHFYNKAKAKAAFSFDFNQRSVLDIASEKISL